MRILTIHKSKGLEYKHVILLDRLKRKPAPRDSIIFEYDGIVLRNLYLRTKGREELDRDYGAALQRERDLAYEDTLNTLYVAFTRAQESLFVLTKPKDSMFDIVDLKVETRGRLVLQSRSHTTSKTQEEIEYKDLYYGTQSDILTLESDKDEDIGAIHFGIAMHYFLEMLPTFSPSSINTATTALLNKYGSLLDDTLLEDIKKRGRSLVENEQFLTLVEGDCFKEKPLRYKKQLRYIDLLVQKDPHSWVVIDYKTSLLFQDEHREQLSNYVAAIKEITKGEVVGYLVYLLADEIKIVAL
jgi:exodeoxyribonuclease V beta subunit